MRNKSLLLCVLLLTGCASMSEPLVITKQVLIDRPTLIVPQPQPAEQYPFSWVVITKGNAVEKFAELESKGVAVVFAITPDGYQNLALGGAELRRYILQQESVIAAYKQYYDRSPEMAPEAPPVPPSLFSSWRLW